MTIMSSELIISRIEAATPASPIAVFKSDVKGSFDVVFANTVTTQKIILEGSRKLVGIYHNGMDMLLIEKFLTSVCESEIEA